MAEQEIRFLGDLEKLTMEPGDKFVLSVPGAISMNTADHLQAMWRAFAGPDAPPVLILSDGIKLGAISGGDDHGEAVKRLAEAVPAMVEKALRRREQLGR